MEGLKIPWPKTPGGNLRTDQDTWELMAAAVPEVFDPYKDLRGMLRWLRGDLDLRVSDHGRSRPKTFPFDQKTGRTSPSASSIFSCPRWMRRLIRAPVGSRLCHADFAQQEPARIRFLSAET